MKISKLNLYQKVDECVTRKIKTMLPVKAADFAALEVFSLLYEETTFFAFLFFIHNNIPLYAWLATKSTRKNSAILIKKPSWCSFST